MSWNLHKSGSSNKCPPFKEHCGICKSSHVFAIQYLRLSIKFQTFLNVGGNCIDV